MRTGRPFIFSLLLAPPLAAQTVSFGLCVGGAATANDLHAFNRNMGATVGGFLDLDYGGGSIFRSRVDVLLLPREEAVDEGLPYKREFRGGSLGLDYLYHLSGRRRGLFGIAGVGLYPMEARIQGGGQDQKKKSSQIGGSMGLGYTFTENWAVDLRYTYTSFNSGLPSQRSVSDPTEALTVLAGAYRF